VSIDHVILVTPELKAPLGRVYNRFIVREIPEQINREGGKDYGDTTVYIVQAGCEYLYIYKREGAAESAREDFETWRAEPCESIHPQAGRSRAARGRLPLTKERIEEWKAMKAKEEEAAPWNFGTEEDDD